MHPSKVSRSCCHACCASRTNWYPKGLIVMADDKRIQSNTWCQSMLKMTFPRNFRVTWGVNWMPRRCKRSKSTVSDAGTARRWDDGLAAARIFGVAWRMADPDDALALEGRTGPAANCWSKNGSTIGSASRPRFLKIPLMFLQQCFRPRLPQYQVSATAPRTVLVSTDCPWSFVSQPTPDQHVGSNVDSADRKCQSQDCSEGSEATQWSKSAIWCKLT